MMLQGIYLLLFGIAYLSNAVVACTSEYCCTSVRNKYLIMDNYGTTYVCYIQVRTIKPFCIVMSPDWLHRYSTLTGNYTSYPEYLEIGYTTLLGQASLFQQAMQVELVAPRGLTNLV